MHLLDARTLDVMPVSNTKAAKEVLRRAFHCHTIKEYRQIQFKMINECRCYC